MVSLDSPWTSWYLFLFKIIEKVPSFNKEIKISGDLQTYTSLHTLIFRVLYSIPIYDILFFVKQINYGFWVHILIYWTFWPKNGFWEFGNKMPEILQLGYQSVSISISMISFFMKQKSAVDFGFSWFFEHFDTEIRPLSSFCPMKC